MNDRLKIKFWGVRGSTPSPNLYNMEFGGNTTCIQIEIDGFDELLIADCGTGIRNLGNELIDTKLKGKIFVTHPHWDHLQGFSFFKPFNNSRNHFEVYMPPQGSKGCEEVLQKYLSDTFFPISIGMFKAKIDFLTYEKEKLDFERYSVEYMSARHTMPTAIYKFHVNNKEIVFAPDNEIPSIENASDESFIKEFQEFVAGADVLIHDSQFDKNQYNARKGWGHSDWQTVLETTKDLQVKKLLLTHHDPDNNDKVLANRNKEIQESYGQYFEQVCLVKEGQEIILS
ncbi:MAG: MBL fold metallo-hydrolase [Balneolaceae bacterium]